MAVQLYSGAPVPGFDMTYSWHSGEWEALFDEQIALVKSDIYRARMADKLVVYLSCPLSPRGGGHGGTNVDIALATQRRLLSRWGEGTWILNPANYQMESRAGTGLMNMHAQSRGIDLKKLIHEQGLPTGGDYMRMWTKVLVENGPQIGRTVVPESLRNTGQYFDAYYFVGPDDVREFFQPGLGTWTAAIETYFARRMEADPDFRDTYSTPSLSWGASTKDMDSKQLAAHSAARDDWRERRGAFIRYYMFRAGVNYSLGSHDEWNILCKLNSIRRAMRERAGIAEQIAGFFDGRQIDPSATEMTVSSGYAT